ncbi:formate transporter FocA [Succinimonas sp.]|uniref:formate transporter FocA n=1 Tax=Succinimonas sp. TaxID=1936151 RepID=UPI0038633423
MIPEKHPCCLSAAETAKAAESITEHKANRPSWQAFLMAINAGAFIALAFMFYTTALADGHGKLVGGLCFSLGLMLCVLLSGELFTSSTLTLVARASGLTSWRQLLKNWGIVYCGNLAGGLFVVFLVLLARQYDAFHGQWGQVVLDTSLHKLSHFREGESWFRGFLETMTLGIFCNIMVCLAVWLGFAGKTLTDKMLAMIFPVGMFVASGFEHSIANMFMIPAGISIVNFAEPSFWSNAGLDIAKYQGLTVDNFIVRNLLPVTIGNIIGGGIFVGLWNWYLNVRAAGKKTPD